MLIQLGEQKEGGDVVDSLLECHERIRHFCGLAIKLAHLAKPDFEAIANDEIKEAAHWIYRYFQEALPLHAEDEDSTVMPRLMGHNDLLDNSLKRMNREHESIETHLKHLLPICKTIEESPEQLLALQSKLRLVAQPLAMEFKTHLENEEHAIFPYIRKLLKKETLEKMSEELKQRRISE